ncbi:DNA-binding transcriptional regulator, MerR family [Lacrimispora sphenoides]|jgi:DNA-binding transcriptional MerR regulator|uniref:MerR family transcriptional regulator n=1 Tax=Lacrimispora sphenoides TaxID=29370 RepID=UPI0008BAED90|nr:MerR family transcriptional regulator [Lacrimispora sphenoides]SEU12124.1 DNA-binding transcriptional regulator, MerR family [Lacrimispora sphenoides]
MEYTINKLAKLAGVSTRTLRYYDELGLLSPARVSSNGYRIYGQKEIDRLQQILFYRELGVSLEEIRNILASKDFDGLSALESHLTALLARREQLNLLVANVEKTIKTMKGEMIMSDQEKFEGFLQKLVDHNEHQYGEEARAKYGDERVNRSNAKVLNMSKEQFTELERLTEDLNETLKAAFEQGDPASELAQKACKLHKRWLCFYWDDYSKEAHKGVTQMYVDDPRFTAYYDKISPGCAAFLRDAVAIYCK